jgi:hypothetical protein
VTLKALVLRGPDPERDGVSTWRAKDLCQIVEGRFGVSYTENGILRLLHDLGLFRQKARPVHPEADLKARFKKFPALIAEVARDHPEAQADRGLVPRRGPGRLASCGCYEGCSSEADLEKWWLPASSRQAGAPDEHP